MRPSPESLAFAVLIIYDWAEPTQHLRLNLSPSLPHRFSERKPWPLVAAAYANYLRKKHTPEFLKTTLSRGLISFGLFAYATRTLTECGKLTKHVPVFVFCFLSSPFINQCFVPLRWEIVQMLWWLSIRNSNITPVNVISCTGISSKSLQTPLTAAWGWHPHLAACKNNIF